MVIQINMKANVDLKDSTGSTPLMKASALGRFDMVIIYQ
jgi:hypothetical protein